MPINVNWMVDLKWCRCTSWMVHGYGCLVVDRKPVILTVKYIPGVYKLQTKE